jgi:hypothetical protein
MGWLSRLLNFVPKEEQEGIHLNLGIPVWKVSSPKDFPSFLRALIDLIPESSIAYIEGGTPPRELRAFLKERSVSEISHIEMGTIWPRPEVFHLPATPCNLSDLADIAQKCAGPEVAIHFHVYNNNKVLLQWFDAFFDPMFISKEIPEDKVKEFCTELSITYEMFTDIKNR